ncbi:phosphoribosyltransferase [Deferribacter autotrophicus]|uniref:Phosphoribosyltransferase n=1 Tax=Deferribacter autotrophicus TaxID=500465 RepID=A0A5A8F911_9BACT|nr:phosphoribosyltransferase family protein [Deferribacter autotrophicus]KAA0259551.1 phosphoribosyltransferase [Deferribacter autotrophicus]
MIERIEGNALIDYKKKFYNYFKNNAKINGDIINVQSFLNHQVLPEVLEWVAGFFKESLSGIVFDKFLTVESSGISFASILSYLMGKPFIFAKKKRPITMDSFYYSKSYSFTKQTETELFVSKDVLLKGDKIVFVDDFFAQGATLNSIEDICKQANAEILAKCVVVNKSDRDDIISLINSSDLERIVGECYE